MLFAVSLAYLVFGGSSLIPIRNFITGKVKNFLGADIFISLYFSQKFLPEANLKEFLDAEMKNEDSRVLVRALQTLLNPLSLINMASISSILSQQLMVYE